MSATPTVVWRGGGHQRLSSPKSLHYHPSDDFWQKHPPLQSCTHISDHSSPMASAYRDRTVEFRSLSETLKKIGGATPAPPDNQADSSQSASKQSTPVSFSRSEFNRKASRIGLGIHETSQKIARLAQCKPIFSYYSIFIVINTRRRNEIKVRILSFLMISLKNCWFHYFYLTKTSLKICIWLCIVLLVLIVKQYQ